MNRYLQTLSLGIAMLFGLAKLSAQVSSYSFSQSSATYTTITGGTLLASGSSMTDLTFSVTLPFTFYFNGKGFTQIYVSENGFITFGSVNPYPSSFPIDNVTYTYDGAVAGFANGMGGQTGTEVRAGVLGSGSNRTFVAQWTKMRISLVNQDLNFQVRLNESDNSIQVVYGTMSNTSSSTAMGQVGLRGASNTDYACRVTSTNWASTSNGGSPSGYCSITSTVFPASGLTFTWTPTACPGNPTAGTISSSLSSVCVNDPFTLTLGGQSSNVTYQWEQSPTGTGSWTTIPSATGTSYNVTGITTTTYYRVKVTCQYLSAYSSYTPVKVITINSAFPTVATLPYSQSFENTWQAGCATRQLPDDSWRTNPNTGNRAWRRNDDGTSALWTTTTGTYSPAATAGSYRRQLLCKNAPFCCNEY